MSEKYRFAPEEISRMTMPQIIYYMEPDGEDGESVSSMKKKAAKARQAESRWKAEAETGKNK